MVAVETDKSYMSSIVMAWHMHIYDVLDIYGIYDI